MKKRNYNPFGREEARAVLRVLRRGELSGFLARGEERFYGGFFVRRLEDDFKKYFGTKYAVSFNSATTALQAAVAALGIGPGDQVITTPFTMSATATAILLNNAVPVFADIDPETYCLNAETIAERITKKTKAIIVVNLLGSPADHVPILKLANKYKLKIIEDNAQAPGAKYHGRYTGTIGDIGVFSFNVHKTIQSGEGGMMVTNNKKYAYRAQLLRNHGEIAVDDWWADKDKRELIAGSNFRLTEIQAAIMIEQLKKLKKLNARRVQLANYLTGRLLQFKWLRPVQVLTKSTHVYYRYPIQVLSGSRKKLMDFLEKRGFGDAVSEGYQKPLYLLPVYQEKRIYARSQFPFVSEEYPQTTDYRKGLCPVAERLYEQSLLTFNIFTPEWDRSRVDKLVNVLTQYGQEK